MADRRHRFGTLTPEDEARIRQLPVEKLEALGESFVDFVSVADLNNWLARN